VTDLNLAHGTVSAYATGASPGAPAVNPGNVNDGSDSTESIRNSYVTTAAGTNYWGWQADLGAPYTVDAMTVRNGTYGVGAGELTIYGSSDGATWHAIALAEVYADPLHTYTFDAPELYRYWRIESARYTAGLTYIGYLTCRTWAINEGAPLLEADFTAAPQTGTAPLSVAFTDTSAGTPTTWAWDFGDGDTSSSQDPTHVYAADGSYTVTLEVGDGTSTDTIVKTAYVKAYADVGYTPPEPAGAILEIYAAAPGSARWGVSKWGSAVWSDAAWQDVTPEGITCAIRWGSQRGELGILATPDATTWAITTYDPSRLLDPNNLDSPWYADLIAGLPIRLSHRGIVVRKGYAEAIGYSHAEQGGYIRGTDAQARLSNAAVPSDTTLPDTLFARARAAIAAAGVSLEVLPDPVGGDPALAPWSTGLHEWSIWQWVSDAAQSVLWIPYIDRLERLGFRAWAAPLERGRSITAPVLVDLQVVSDWAGLYSVIQAQETAGDGGAVQERRRTPLPRYGARTFARTEPTPNAGDWAAAVLTDRSTPTLRWVPADIYPVTADDVERLATLESTELVTLGDSYADPAVYAAAVIVGGSMRVVGRAGNAADWRFAFTAGAAAITPLIVDGTTSEYLYSDTGTEYLYPG